MRCKSFSTIRPAIWLRSLDTVRVKKGGAEAEEDGGWAQRNGASGEKENSCFRRDFPPTSTTRLFTSPRLGLGLVLRLLCLGTRRGGEGERERDTASSSSSRHCARKRAPKHNKLGNAPPRHATPTTPRPRPPRHRRAAPCATPRRAALNSPPPPPPPPPPSSSSASNRGRGTPAGSGPEPPMAFGGLALALALLVVSGNRSINQSPLLSPSPAACEFVVGGTRFGFW